MKISVTAAVALSLSITAACAGQPIKFISHRGESLEAPENTMASFRLAVEHQTAGFELDVDLTSDNEIICLHDKTLERTTNGSGKPGDFTLDELKKLDAGSWKAPQFAGERIPTLSEALSLARDNFEIYVEIKSGTEIMPRLLEVMAAAPEATPARVVFISFKTDVVEAVREQLPEYRVYWVVGAKEQKDGSITPSAASAIATMQRIKASGIDLQGHGAEAQKLIDKEYVKAIKDAGFGFHVWTVNHAARAAELAAMGAETITTDCGAALAQALCSGTPDSRPVIHWTFDGTAKNIGTGGARYDAILSGSPEYVAGVRGKGLQLDGAEVLASAPYQLPLRGAVALWFKPDGFYNHNTIFDNNINADSWEMWIYADGRLTFRVVGDSGAVGYNLNELGGAGRWYHLAVVWDYVDTRDVKLYVNGVERSTGTMPRWALSGGTFQVGGGNPGNTKGRGLVDDVRVYNLPLSQAQVMDLYRSTQVKTEPTL